MNALDSARRNDLTHIFATPNPAGLSVAELNISCLKRVGDGVSPDVTATKKLLPANDTDAAELLLNYFNNELLYTSDGKTWRLWNGRVYETVDPASIGKAIINLARALEADIEYVFDWWEQRAAVSANGDRKSSAYKDEMKRFEAVLGDEVRYAKRLLDNAGQKALTEVLHRQAATTEALFDADTSIFVVSNGVIDLDETKRTGKVVLLPHNPGRMVTQHTDVEYDAAATAPHWDHYLGTSIPDADVRHYLQVWTGSALRGKPVDKGFLNLMGPQDSGKSLWEKTMALIFGSYSITVEPSVFMKKGADSNNFDLHELRGKRLVLTSEPAAGQYLDDNVIKSLTGGDAKRTRTLFQGFVTWHPQCTIIVASNHGLKYNVDDQATGGRYKVISFPNKFVRTRYGVAPGVLVADLGLEDKLKGELPGILNWALSGLLEYFDKGMDFEPDGVDAARRQVEQDNDNRAAWLQWAVNTGRLENIPYEYQDDTDAIPNNRRLKADEAYKSYIAWCLHTGEKVKSQKLLGSYLNRKSETKMSGGTRYLRWYAPLPQLLQDPNEHDNIN